MKRLLMRVLSGILVIPACFGALVLTAFLWIAEQKADE